MRQYRWRMPSPLAPMGPWGFHGHGGAQNGWSTMENPSLNGWWLGIPLFEKPPYDHGELYTCKCESMYLVHQLPAFWHLDHQDRVERAHSKNHEVNSCRHQGPRWRFLGNVWINCASQLLYGVMWLKQCRIRPIWEWVLPPIKMVMTGGWFIIVLTTLLKKRWISTTATGKTRLPRFEFSSQGCQQLTNLDAH